MRYTPVFAPGTLVAALLISTAAIADDVLVIDDNLDVLPDGYTLATGSSDNATASLEIGDIGASNGLIFTGSWNVPANGQEFAVGALVPPSPTAMDFQFDPAGLDGITSLQWTLDLAVISATMNPPTQGIFAQLVVYQLQPDDSVLVFPDGGNFIAAGDMTTIDVTAVESDFGQPGSGPDFSASGGPISFGLQFGAVYPGSPVPAPFFLNGRLEADNWAVTVSTGTQSDVFRDGFEEPVVNGPAAAKSALPPAVECDCAAPSALPWPLRD